MKALCRIHMIDGLSGIRAKGFSMSIYTPIPAHVIASYTAKRRSTNFNDNRYGQQTALFESNSRMVIDSADIRS